MRAHTRDERVGIVAVDDQAVLAHPLDALGQRVEFIGPGVVLSTALASHLMARPGDLVEVEVTEGRRPRALLPVTGLANDWAGLTAYLTRRTLNQVMGDGDLASGVNLLLKTDERAEFYRAIARLPQVVSAASRDDTVTAFRSVVAQVLMVEMSFFLGFAAAIAFGVSYNISRTALADRARDLATLRVLGFGRAECAYILTGELLWLGLLAAPFGMLGGAAMAQALVSAFARQDFHLSLAITARGLGITFGVYLVAIAGAAALVTQRIWSFDLVAVLKTRE